MPKPSTFLLLFSIFICLPTISDVAAQTTSKTDEGVQDVILDKTEATLACPGLRPNIGYCNEEARKINISTIAKDAEKKGLTFYYLVEGGKIIGKGKDVVWDVSDTKPGKYLIAVGVGKDGIIQGDLITKTVSVSECGCYPSCACPSISISGSTARADAGDTLIFTANVAGGSQNTSTFNWTISDGKITQGQGTSQILVKTTKEMKGQTITATVEVGGVCETCLTNTASASAEIKDK